MYCFSFFRGMRKFWILNHLRRDSMKCYDVREQWIGRRGRQRFARNWIYATINDVGSQQDRVASLHPAVTAQDVHANFPNSAQIKINPPETGCLLAMEEDAC